MRDSFLPFCKPPISESDIEAVVKVLRSGWITTGPKVTELERAVAARCGTREAVAATSGTALMHLYLMAIGLKPGDEVVGPSMTWVSTPNIVELMGGRNVFVDADRDTLLASPEALEAAITPRTKVVIPVHYCGAPVDLDPIRALCARRGVLLLEDAAHAIGTHYKGREIGHGATAIFSLHPIKTITSGEGGVLVTDDAALAAKIRRLRFHGLEAAAPAPAARGAQQGRSPHAEVQEPGFKQNMADMNAVLALNQFPRIDAFIQRREALAKIYHELLADVDGVTPLGDPAWPHRHARHLMVVRVDERRCGMERAAFMEALKARNIGTGIHFLAAHTHRWYRENRPEPAGRLANTEWNSARICTLPLFPDMTDDDVRGVVAAIKDILPRAAAKTAVSGAAR